MVCDFIPPGVGQRDKILLSTLFVAWGNCDYSRSNQGCERRRAPRFMFEEFYLETARVSHDGKLHSFRFTSALSTVSLGATVQTFA